MKSTTRRFHETSRCIFFHLFRGAVNEPPHYLQDTCLSKCTNYNMNKPTQPVASASRSAISLMRSSLMHRLAPGPLQSVSQRYLCQVIHPIGGVRAKPLSSANTSLSQPRRCLKLTELPSRRQKNTRKPDWWNGPPNESKWHMPSDFPECKPPSLSIRCAWWMGMYNK